MTPQQFHDAPTMHGGWRPPPTAPMARVRAREARRAVWRRRARRASWVALGFAYASAAMLSGWGVYHLLVWAHDLGVYLAVTRG